MASSGTFSRSANQIVPMSMAYSIRAETNPRKRACVNRVGRLPPLAFAREGQGGSRAWVEFSVQSAVHSVQATVSNAPELARDEEDRGLRTVK